MNRSLKALLVCALAPNLPSLAQQKPNSKLPETPTLYVVGYAHLDTQWRWEYPQVISEFLPKTLNDNFALIDKYPNYVFNFSGSNRYRMIKEYYPDQFAKLRHYVNGGRWFLAGSSVEESDVNSPSAESILRQVLYGNHYFQKELGHHSAEYMLPDCFGFPASLPTLLAHAGVKGFSTQKLTWGSAAPVGGPDSPERTPEGTPFNVGRWIGPDGNGVLAALNPGSYSGSVTYDLSKSPAKHSPDGEERVDWVSRIQRNGSVSGIPTDYHYYGTGDTGGAPDEESVKIVNAMASQSQVALPDGKTEKVGTGPVHVASSTAEQMFLDILATGHVSGLPQYAGDLELTNHSAGSLTSEAYQKRWNRKNELLADAAEKASLAVHWLGLRSYPQQRLNDAWTLVMGGQFHDIMAGTATPRAYEFSWNDDVIAMNQFAAVLTDATSALASQLDTSGPGIPIVVYNPLATARQDVIEAQPKFPGQLPKSVQVIGPDGEVAPSQMEGSKVLFLAKAPSAGFAVYHIKEAAGARTNRRLRVGRNSLENARYRVNLDANGDIASVFDKQLNRELLSAPMRLAFQSETPQQWPAWNMDWSDQSKPPRGYVSGPVQSQVVENGPVRVAISVTRHAEQSTFVQTIRLSDGDAGNRVEIENEIDWKSKAAVLKATFPLTASNPKATYNWDVATIERANNDPKKFEVPSHQFIDLTNESADFGVTVLTDCKNGSDKPADNLLRLSLIYTPGISKDGQDYSDQATQDWGHHSIVYGLVGHQGDFKSAHTDEQAYRLNQPLIAFETTPHSGNLGKTLSVLDTGSARVRVMALKKAENEDAAIVRLVEIDGEQQPNVRIHFAMPVESAQEVNGQEEPLGPVEVDGGALNTSFKPHQIRTFELRMKTKPHAAPSPSQPLSLQYDAHVTSRDGQQESDGFDGKGNALPAEMLPATIDIGESSFKLGPADSLNAETARGQSIDLPAGHFTQLHLLAASFGGDQSATFKVGDHPASLTIQDWGGFVGQWFDRTWSIETVQNHWDPLPANISADSPRGKEILEWQKEHPTREEMKYTGLKPAFIKRDQIAWYASHHHDSKGANQPYAYSYLFAYTLPVPSGAKTLTLPNNPNIRILAASVTDTDTTAEPVQPLYDAFSNGQKGQR